MYDRMFAGLGCEACVHVHYAESIQNYSAFFRTESLHEHYAIWGCSCDFALLFVILDVGGEPFVNRFLLAVEVDAEEDFGARVCEVFICIALGAYLLEGFVGAFI